MVPSGLLGIQFVQILLKDVESLLVEHDLVPVDEPCVDTSLDSLHGEASDAGLGTLLSGLSSWGVLALAL